MVGWEIFNETRMGATDFDRRIQMIRAISGELSRNIRRISGVEDARVQIVIPETQLFQATKSPVTAAVLLKITPGFKLKSEQIAGIVHLTSSSVENLQPENVTVVDETGNILSQKGVETVGQPRMETEIPAPVKTLEAVTPIEQNIISKTSAPAAVPTQAATSAFPSTSVSTAAAAAAVNKEEKTPHLPLTAEEKTLLKLKAKEEYERQLTAKIQDLLNQFYPPNGVITKVSLDFGTPAKGKTSNLKIKSNSESLVQPIKLIKVFVLVDNRVNLTAKLKKNTYQTVSEVVGYDRKRGDKIILKKVPFHYATTPPVPKKPKSLVQMIPIRSTMVLAIFTLAALVLVLIVLYLMRPRKEKTMPFEDRLEPSAAPSESEAGSVIDEIKNLAGNDPERIANLLKKWLTEE
ncbi:MAG TPA: flagellar M-ring protein FliF C-terminal domain-containing protein, partial [Candidatus Omnitrophota bacterium]|nr:flagellar M-ring protein FliF C-terminal domain-containing protein [Candidatus Omnitrophota bacterium]